MHVARGHSAPDHLDRLLQPAASVLDDALVQALPHKQHAMAHFLDGQPVPLAADDSYRDLLGHSEQLLVELDRLPVAEDAAATDPVRKLSHSLAAVFGSASPRLFASGWWVCEEKSITHPSPHLRGRSNPVPTPFFEFPRPARTKLHTSHPLSAP